MREEFERAEAGVETLEEVRERKRKEENKKWVSGAWIERREQIVAGLEGQFGDMLKDMSPTERRKLLSNEVMNRLKTEAREKAEEANYASPEEEIMYTHTQELEEKYQQTIQEIENAQVTKRRYPDRQLYIPAVGRELDKKIKEFVVMAEIRKPSKDVKAVEGGGADKAAEEVPAVSELQEHEEKSDLLKEAGEVFEEQGLKEGMSGEEQEKFAAWITDRGGSGQDIPNDPGERLALYRKETEGQSEDKKKEVA